MNRQYYVYILASLSGTLYIGMTNNLHRRIYEHKSSLVEGFSKKYNCHKLIYFEEYKDVYDAMRREKQLKKWRREKKEKLINMKNPEWCDLYQDISCVPKYNIDVVLNEVESLP